MSSQTPPNGSPPVQNHIPLPPMDFHARLNEAAGTISFRKLGRLTDTHPETVRRYMQGQAPSATFLTNLCRALGISGEWLLTGKGPMKCTDLRSHALSQADPSELMTAVADTLTDLCDRMDRLEHSMQGLETRVRGVPAAGNGQAVSKPKATKLGSNPDSITQCRETHEGEHEQSKRSIESKPDCAQRIRDAIAKRSS